MQTFRESLKVIARHLIEADDCAQLEFEYALLVKGKNSHINVRRFPEAASTPIIPHAARTQSEGYANDDVHKEGHN